MAKHQGIMSVQEFQEMLEQCVRDGFLSLPPVCGWQVKYIRDAYRKAENKQAKQALLIQPASVLSKLRLRNPAKRFEKILAGTGVEKHFAYMLLAAYTNQKEGL